MEYPLEGRLFLPPDCETIGHLIFKLIKFHQEEATADYKGKEHVEKHIRLMSQARQSLDILK